MSRVTLGKASTISKRAKAVPSDALFKADVESVKSKNEKKLASNDETESQKFGRWMMRTEQDKGEAIQNRSQSVLETINEEKKKSVRVNNIG